MPKMFTYSYKVSFWQNSAQLVELHNRNTMCMQLTEQNCSCQPALMYIENLCRKLFKLLKKDVQYVSSCFFTFTATHI